MFKSTLILLFSLAAIMAAPPSPPQLGNFSGQFPFPPQPPQLGIFSGQFPFPPPPPQFGNFSGQLPNPPSPPQFGNFSGQFPFPPPPPQFGNLSGLQFPPQFKPPRALVMPQFSMSDIQAYYSSLSVADKAIIVSLFNSFQNGGAQAVIANLQQNYPQIYAANLPAIQQYSGQLAEVNAFISQILPQLNIIISSLGQKSRALVMPQFSASDIQNFLNTLDASDKAIIVSLFNSFQTGGAQAVIDNLKNSHPDIYNEYLPMISMFSLSINDVNSFVNQLMPILKPLISSLAQSIGQARALVMPQFSMSDIQAYFSSLSPASKAIIVSLFNSFQTGGAQAVIANLQQNYPQIYAANLPAIQQYSGQLAEVNALINQFLPQLQTIINQLMQ